jgi:hypothetical protein
MLQLALSFAHVHKHDLVGASFAPADTVSIGPTRQVAERLPAQLADNDNNCPICFSGFLLSNSSLPSTPANPRSLQFAEIELGFNEASDQIFLARHAAFLSRAPPTA